MATRGMFIRYGCFSVLPETRAKKEIRNGTSGQAHAAGTHPLPARRQGGLAMQVRVVEEPAVLRRLAQADARRGAGQALLVRRRRPAARDAGTLRWHPYFLTAPWLPRRAWSGAKSSPRARWVSGSRVRKA